MTLENITGNLRDAYKQSVPGQNLCVDQLMAARRTNPGLYGESFYTADGMVYFVDKGKSTLYITREATNPVFNNIDDAFTQLTTTENYQVLPADFDVVKAAQDTVTIDLTKLTLQGNVKEWRYLAISTRKPSFFNKGYGKLNAEERKLAERVYGQGTDFVANMQMLRNAGIKETNVYVLNPQYVQEHATGNAVERASWLVSFNFGSDFYAIGRYNNVSLNGRLRGVRREGAIDPNPKFII